MHHASRTGPLAEFGAAWCSFDGRRRALVVAALAFSTCMGLLEGIGRDSAAVGVTTAVVGLAAAVAATIDAASRRVPNRLVAAAAAATLVLAAGSAWWPHSKVGAAAFGGAFVGAAIAIAVTACARLVGFDGIGGGDVKLAAVVGAGVGIDSPTNAAVAMAVASASCLLSGVVTRKRVIAFGPSLWVGWLVAESSAILTGEAFPPYVVHMYSRACVASAELWRRGFILGGGI